MIYENDIPDIADVDYSKIHGCRLLRMLKKVRSEPRWKPNGITNNIEQYESKSGLKGETNLKKRIWKHALRKAVYNYCKKHRYSAN